MSLSVLVTNLHVTGSTLIYNANLSGIGSVQVSRSGDYILISGAAGTGGGGSVTGDVTQGQLDALSGFTTGMSGALQNQISMSSAGVISINNLSGNLNILGTRGIGISISGQTIYVSGQDWVTTGGLNQASGVLDIKVASTGQQFFSLATGMSGQAVTDYATKTSLALTGSGLYTMLLNESGSLLGVITQTGQQAWIAANNNGINLSGQLGSLSGYGDGIFIHRTGNELISGDKTWTGNAYFTSGLVGVGNRTPQRLLHVMSGTSAGYPTFNQTDIVLFENTSGVNTSVILLANRDNVTQFFFSDQDSRTQGALSYNHSGDFMSLNVNAALLMRLSGNSVGIGTANPQANLHVTGIIRTDAGYFSGVINLADILYPRSNPSGYITGQALLDYSGFANAIFVHRTGNELISGDKYFNDKVGIGTTGLSGQLTFGRQSLTDIFTYGNSDIASIQFYQAQNFPASNNFQRVLDINAGGSNAGSHIHLLTSNPTATSTVKLAIDPAGNVGIGTIAPIFPLTVDSALNPSGQGAPSILVQGSANKERIEIRSFGQDPVFSPRRAQADGSAVVNGANLGYFLAGGFDGQNWVSTAGFKGLAAETFGTGNGSGLGSHIVFESAPATSRARTEKMRITDSGNVGISNTNPNARLTIGNPANAVGAMSTTLGVYAGNLGSGVGSGVTIASFGVGPNNTTALGIHAYRPVTGIDFASTVIGLGIDVDNTPAGTNGLWLNPNGNVGINTVLPSGTLALSTGPQWSASNYGANLIIQGTRNNAIGFLDPNNQNPWAIANNTSILAFSTMPALGNTAAGAVERLVISTGGLVGIGTNNPSAQLHTTSTVRFAGLPNGVLTTDANGNVFAAASGATQGQLDSVSGWTNNFFVHRTGAELISGDKTWIGQNKFQYGSSVFGTLFGADSNATTLTNSTNKTMTLAMPHFLNAEEPVRSVGMLSSSTINSINLGGGSTDFNAATEISFHTATNTTTTNGTRQGGFNASGVFDLVTGLGIRTRNPTGALHVNGPVCLSGIDTTTSANAGGGSTLPLTPVGFVTINITGGNFKIPYYNV